MTSFTRYSLLDLSDPSLAHQVVTDITEDLFCGISVQSIFVAEIQEGGERAKDFGVDLWGFLSRLPAQCKGDDVVPLKLWEVLEDHSISKGIAMAVSIYVRSLAAYRDEAAASAEVGNLMSFNDDVVEAGAPSTPQDHAPEFRLDPATAQALVDRKAYEGLTMAGYTKILSHKSYFEFVSEKLYWVLDAYAHRIMHAIEQDPSIWVHRDPKAWARTISGVPPHLIIFDSYKAGKTAIISIFKSKKDQHRPGYVRMHWSCGTLDRHLDIPERVVQATKAAIATAPKVPYLASEWAGHVLLFVHPSYQKRWAKGAPVPKNILGFWRQDKFMDWYECDPYGCH